MAHPDPSNDAQHASLSGEELPQEHVSLALLARAQDGDRDALQELIDRYQDRLRRIVRIQLGASTLRRQHDSMDLVQETFLAALPRIGDLRPRSAASLLQWLALIATNQIRDAYAFEHAAKRDAHRTVPLDAPVEGRRAASELPAAASGPAGLAELEEIRELLDAEVALLPADQRRVVLLRDYCGEGWDRIGQDLDREPAAARQLHQRAWIRLRRALRPRLEERPPSA
ncbi:MAG: sigma-70 family RNA polymerase sigma factor [Planctomycetota bacterium]